MFTKIKVLQSFMPKFSNHLWKMSSKNLKQFRHKKLTKSYGYTLGKSANNFIYLYATAKLLPATETFVPNLAP